MSEAGTSLTVCLYYDADPDGDRPARPGLSHSKRDAKWKPPHNFTSMFESKAFAKVGAADPADAPAGSAHTASAFDNLMMQFLWILQALSAAMPLRRPVVQSLAKVRNI
ncbi:hypothetical protein J5289_07745 [Rhizobium sp. B230/85]|uniref:hypothetical protein n=1 Tax=unclassified Rhizobium TaxID=2613769 RepID=UPI001ADB5FBB|nr:MULTISPECIES: hypothetical protein [unclassified Rhizobium]MBO9133379.1 hypothetical protein [Rhizobium sp. B209b/85]QXZ97437.1 hypothetical protein J5289_07745 [Rhizobium sp. B230/85]